MEPLFPNSETSIVLLFGREETRELETSKIKEVHDTVLLQYQVWG